jgi:diguanylate cyclase (GGDEF)-like protein
MRPDEKLWHPFLVLTANASELGERALHSVLEGSGFAVRGADSGRHVLQLARTVAPDVVILDSRLSDMSGEEVCRLLSGDATFSPTVPILLLSTHGSWRADRLQAYSAGAWDVCSSPLDGAVLLLKLQTFLRARQAAERLRDGSLLDAPTGLYNIQGLRRRANELGADASRRREPLAFIAFTLLLEGQLVCELGALLIERVAESCRRNVRGSDVLGRLSATDFALIAPATDAHGAVQVIDRLQTLCDVASAADARSGPSVRIRAGYSATANFAKSSVGPVEMLRRAVLRLEGARKETWAIELDEQERLPFSEEP